MLSTHVNKNLPEFKIEEGDAICSTTLFTVQLDHEYQGKSLGTLIIKTNETVRNWDYFNDLARSTELTQVIRLCELVLIKALDLGEENANDKERLQALLDKKLVNFYGEQVIDANSNREIFFRLVPRYSNSMKIVSDDSSVLEVKDDNYGKAFYFKPSNKITVEPKFLIALTNKLRSCLKNNFKAWYTNASSLLGKDFGESETTYDASKHPNNAGLCEVEVGGAINVSINLDQRSQEQKWRTFVQPIGKKYPAIRFLDDGILFHYFNVITIWQKTVEQIENTKDMVFKIMALMNLSAGDPQLHFHLVPSYKPEDKWQRFAYEPFVFNVKGDSEYISIDKNEMNKYKAEFQKLLIECLEKNNATIGWPASH